ncbi:MAG: hypothetical protein ACRDXC_02740, partial [Acidimicrobiales bacterium]
VGRVVSSAGVKAAAHGQAKTAAAAHVAFVSGLHPIFVIGAIAVALGTALAVGLVRSKDFHRPTMPVSPTEPEPAGSTEATTLGATEAWRQFALVSARPAEGTHTS